MLIVQHSAFKVSSECSLTLLLTLAIVGHPFHPRASLFPMTILRKPSFFLKQPRTCRLAASGMIAVLFTLFCTFADAAVFQCKGENGVKVLTDRPEGLRDCTQVHTLAPSPSQPAASAPEIRSPDLNQQPTVIFPSPIAPPTPPHGTFKDPIPPKSEVEKPVAPTASDTPRCASRINPLNPLTGGNCPPDAVDPSIAPNKP